MALLGGIGGVVSALGSVVGTIGAISQAKYQQQVAKTNAKVAEDNARIAAQKAQSEAQINDQQTRALVGQQLSLQSASGLSTNSGSALRVRKSTYRIGRQDSMRIRQSGAYDVQNYLQQSENFKAEAAAAGQNAALAGIGGVLGAFSSLVPSSPTPSLISGAKTTPMANKINARDPWLGMRTVTV
ncbi:MAG TPA: hypothetical protein VIM69_10665 [Opitutaceae bacterium]